MALSSQQRDELKRLITRVIERKLTDYLPETNKMPFHERLLGADRMALFSFVQSLNTTFGVSIFEQAAVIVARPNVRRAISQYKEFNNTISPEAQRVIQSILDYLKIAQVKSDKTAETARILAVAQTAPLREVKRPRIDFFMETHDGTEYYFDLKTAKPNINEFLGLKRMLLEWIAIRGAQNPKAKVRTMLGIPYNLYAPEPYQRYTMQGMFDLSPPDREVMVAEEFWDFLGGANTYRELLDVFEETGRTLRPAIDKRIARFSAA